MKDSVWDVLLKFAIPFLVTSCAYLLYQRKKGELTFERLSSVKLFSGTDSLSERLKIYYDQEQITNLSIIEFLLKNTGNIPITKDDFTDPIKVSFPESFKIFSMDVIGKNPDTITSTYQFNNNFFVIDPLLLNKNDEVIYKVIVSRPSAPNFQLNYRIKGISKIKTKRNSTPEIIIYVTGGIVTAAMIASFILVSLNYWEIGTQITIYTAPLFAAIFLFSMLYIRNKEVKQNKKYTNLES